MQSLDDSKCTRIKLNSEENQEPLNAMGLQSLQRGRGKAWDDVIVDM